jgi:hypothetical protein
MKKIVLKFAKIVGAGNGKHWAQTHVFFAKDQKCFTKGHLIAVFSVEKKQEAVDITSFGKEIITRFHEIYYSPPGNACLKRLEQSIDSLVAEFDKRVKLEITAAVVLEQKQGRPVGYFSRHGKGAVFLQREGKVVKLLGLEEEKKSVSGFLEKEDMLLLGSKQFFDAVSLGGVKAGLQKQEPEAVSEDWGALIQGRDQNSRTAAVITKVLQKRTPVEEEKAQPELDQNKKPKKINKRKKSFKKKISNAINAVKNSPQTLKEFIKDFKTERTKYYQDREHKEKGKKTTLTIAIILIVILSVSVFFGVQHKQKVEQEEKLQTVLEEIKYQYDQAESLQGVNPVRARSLLEETKALIEEELPEFKGEEREQLEAELIKTSDQLSSLLKKYSVEDPELFLDLNLVKSEYSGKQWGVNEGEVVILGEEGKTILSVDLEQKSYEIVGGGEEYKAADYIGSVNERGFIIDDNNVWVLDLLEKEVIDQKSEEDFGEISQAVGFGSNLYLLDRQEAEIWKYVGIDTGLGDRTSFLEEEISELSGGVSMAIDGAVWVLLENGNIYKLIRGERDNFVVKGLPDSLSEPKDIYTDPEQDNLYVLDQKKTRIVVINKETGEYQAQYVWQGLAGVKDVYADEEQRLMIVLTGERIYQLELK